MAQVGLAGKETRSPVAGAGMARTNDNFGSDMFSPTSAAAWALSTLHNFGASGPSNISERPTMESLTGTRLFNNGTSRNGDKVPSQLNTSAGVNSHFLPGVAAAQATTSITWGHHAQFQHPDNTNFVDPSPLHMRINEEMHPSGSSLREKPLARMIPITSMVTPTPKKLKVEGNLGASAYSRKKKSLGVLAENFINHYKKLPRGALIIVDHAAIDLGVERRRIYDVVNILEAVKLVSKKQKNTYSWMGMEHLDEMFGNLQADAILNYPEDAKRFLNCTFKENKNITSTDDSKYHLKHLRKENKSLAKLSQEFLQVFLVGFKTLSLPEASDKIQGTASMEELIAMGGGVRKKSTEDGDIPDARELKAAAARGLKTKIRRLYDIANVFLSVGLLRKVENLDTSRRPNFAWSYKLSARELYNLHNCDLSTKEKPSVPSSCSKIRPISTTQVTI